MNRENGLGEGLLSLLAMGSEIQGKTKLQKTVYFLGLMTGCLDDLGYRAHFYGLYSDEVADAIGWLSTIGAVNQTSAGFGTVDNSGFEIRRYDFRLNDQGRQFAEARSRRNLDLWRKLQDAANLLRRSGDLDYVKLSIAAKTYFMLQETDGQTSENDLARLATRFGWEVTPEQVQEAASYLERLGLASIIAD
jgi:uncharacterized protein YwgA